MSFFEEKNNACGHRFSRKQGLENPKRAFSKETNSNEKTSGRLISRKHGLGIPIHIHITVNKYWILTNIGIE